MFDGIDMFSKFCTYQSSITLTNLQLFSGGGSQSDFLCHFWTLADSQEMVGVGVSGR